MKKFTEKIKALLFVMLLGTPLAASAQIEINETNFPDEKFRNYVQNRYDRNYDGILTKEEISDIREVMIHGENIWSLKGIEYFTELIYFECNETQLTVLDLSKNTKLYRMMCGSNQLLTTLNVSGCTGLSDLSCNYNQQLTTLNVSGCTALIQFECVDSQLTTLDVSGCTTLTSFNCDRNQLTTLNVSGCTALRWFSCSTNQLTMLDVSGCTALELLSCHNNQIKGQAMDTLIASLPQNTTSEQYKLYLLDNNDEGNVCTKSQVAAAKAKGWIPYYYDYTADWGKGGWVEYEGYDNDPTAITRPITETVEANTPVYTLSGQKVIGSVKGKKGVYIIGGKKVVIK